MTKQKNKKLSRRDALKLLGAAAGATALANLPSKWSKPEIVSGVLPAHAQTSQPQSTLPTVLTVSIAPDAPSSEADFAGDVTADGGSAVTVRGFVWGTNPNPTLSDNVITAGTAGLGAFTALDQAVAPTGVTLYGRAYATNGVGTAYGNEITFLVAALPGVVTVNATFPGGQVDFDGNVTSDGGAALSDRGFVWSASNMNPTLADTVISVGAGAIGAFTHTGPEIGFPSPGTLIYVRAYATNVAGTAYGAVTTATVCLVEGTLVLMADGTAKKIEDIAYSDWISVWNFDEGRFDIAQPLWIKKAETVNQYNLLEFSDGSSLKTVYQHRIFNKEFGAFTFPMTEDMPIGTTTFNSNGEEVTLVSKMVVKDEQVNYYNVITHRHMNLFANGILTSCMYNNVYPIVDMKFVKDERKLIPQEQYGVEDKYYEGLRLAEQTIRVTDTLAYIKRLEALKSDTELAIV